MWEEWTTKKQMIKLACFVAEIVTGAFADDI